MTDVGKLVNIGAVVTDVLLDKAAQSSTKMVTDDVKRVEPAVTKAVEAAVAPVIEHLTNQEPWYLSRVTLGALGAIFGASYVVFLDFYDGTPPTVDVLTAQGAIIGSSFLTLYGRWIATKPLGK